jgi:hypothetical protein
MYNLSVEGLIWRFYLLMLVVIISFFAGYGIFALVALPILLSAMFGIRFKHAAKEESQDIKGKGTSVSAVAE